MKKQLFLVVALVLCLVISYGAFAAAAKTETLTSGKPLPVPRVVKGRALQIGWLVEDMSFESYQRVWKHAQIEAAHRGWNITPVLDAKTIDAQRDALEVFIRKNVDAIVINYAQMQALKDLVIEARNKGIGVYCVDNTLVPGVIVNATQYNGVVGTRMFYYGVELINGEGKVLILNEARPCIYQERCFAVEGLIKKGFPAIDLVGVEECKEISDYFTKAADYIMKYGNQLDWIFVYADIEGLQAARAIEQAGFSRKDIFVTGIDGGSQVYAEIRNGTPMVATMSQPFEQYCHAVFEVIDQVQIKGIAPGEKGSMVPKGRTLYFDAVLTTPENVPPVGSSIHTVFADTYYDPNDKDAWYFWGEPYKITE